MANRTKRTPLRVEKFLSKLEEAANVTESAKAAGIGRTAVYEWRKQDSDFAAAWDEAEQKAVDRLEREAIRRACEGIDEPVFYQGEQVATIRKYSDRLLEFLLKGNRPEKYKDRVENQMTGKDGKNLSGVVVVPAAIGSLDDWLDSNDNESEKS